VEKKKYRECTGLYSLCQCRASYRSYQLRSDVNLAVGQAEHMVRRAQLLAQSGKEESEWGYHSETGTLFLGTEYDTRDTSFDENIEVPSSVVVSGILEVYFTTLYGVPSGTP